MRKIIIFSLILIIFFLVLGAGYYLFFTRSGLEYAVRSCRNNYAPAGNISIRKIEGSIWQGAALKGVAVKHSPWLPREAILTIQEISISLDRDNFWGIGLRREGWLPRLFPRLNLKVANGKLDLSSADSIIFYGEMRRGHLNFNIYSKYININKTLNLLFPDWVVRDINGVIIDADVYLKGGVNNIELSGGFMLKDSSWYNTLIARDCPATLDLKINTRKKPWQLFGNINFTEGRIIAKCAEIELKPGKISYSGDPKKPLFNLNGAAMVEDTRIHIFFNGTFSHPELKLTSYPVMDQDKLLLMLATGRSWKDTESSLARGQVTPDLMRDFVDYFILGGSGANLAKKMGISEFSLRCDLEARGMKVKTAVSDKAAISYEIIEQTPEKKAEPGPITQNIGLEYKITDKFSIAGEKELRLERNGTLPATQEVPPDDKILLKYKRGF